jgi:ribonucleoside-diphosphate reductase alpha chain
MQLRALYMLTALPRCACRDRSPSPSPQPPSPLPPTKGLPSDYQAFIHTSRYARWVEGKRRRETWPETIDRCSMMAGDA